MLKIRLTRVGKKHDPQYRIIVTEHSNPATGKFIEIIGNYNPKTKQLVINKEKALEWMNKGAKPSNTVARFMVSEKINHKSVVVEQFHKKPKTKGEEDNQTATKKVAKTDESESRSENTEKKTEKTEEKIDVAEVKADEAQEAQESEMTEESSEEQPVEQPKTDESEAVEESAKN